MTFATYLQNKQAHQTASFHISNGRSFLMLNGMVYTEEEFDRIFDLSAILKMDQRPDKAKGDNADSSKAWLY
jgi:hypothetical protein